MVVAAAHAQCGVGGEMVFLVAFSLQPSDTEWCAHVHHPGCHGYLIDQFM